MNDTGIRCIAAGKHDEASHIFQESLREVRSQMAAEVPSEDVITFFQPITTETCKATLFGSVTHDASFEICDIAFGIKFNDGTKANLAFGAAALLYNMALNDHLTFLSTSATCYLKRATSLYKKALQIMLSQDDGRDEDYGKCLFLLSLCNNLGHCFSNLCDVAGKKACQQQMEYILSDPECVNYLRPEDFEFFHLNSLVASADIKTASAA
uniref:KIF-binding protein n=1 Tax=Amphora coffeiformis TaxID=265554 RepID=A0A7S3PAQ7_9STRA